MSFSATEAAFEGFRLVRRNPLALVAWSLLYAVVSVASLFAMSRAMGPLARVTEMAEAMEGVTSPPPADVAALFAAAEAEAGLRLQAQSAYRSYNVQVRVYNGIVASRGQDYADVRSAQPGHSEHQTGLAIDISSLPAVCALDPCFGDTDHGRWLAANAHRFGFHLRYQPEMTPITGYSYEPWHFRYVGVELATELHETGIRTLEEFFGLPPAPTYAG